MTLLFILLTAQALPGALDNIWHHEINLMARMVWSLPTAIAPVNYGPISWFFTLFAFGAAAFALRNALAVLHLRRPAEWVGDPIDAHTNPSARTVLVTGGTGFIGGHLIRRLLTRGDRVVLLTRDADRALDRFGPHVRIITASSVAALSGAHPHP